jgi:hypothetical protein
VEDRQAREICLARNPRSGGEISWAVRLRPSSPRRSRDPARIHDETGTSGTHLSRKTSWPSTFTMSAVRLQRPPPLRHWSESQRCEKPLQHRPGASHCASPAKFNQDVAHTLRFSDTTQRSARQREGRRHARQPSAASKGVAPGSHGKATQGRMPERERLKPAQASEARRREGSKPEGRDGYDGTGRSPRAWRRRAPTRPEPNLSNAPTHVTG